MNTKEHTMTRRDKTTAITAAGWVLFALAITIKTQTDHAAVTLTTYGLVIALFTWSAARGLRDLLDDYVDERIRHARAQDAMIGRASTFDRAAGPPREPSAAAREGAAAITQMVVALEQQGWTRDQALDYLSRLGRSR